MRRNAQEFAQLAEFPCVVGVVDGTHVGLRSPAFEHHVYRNRKGFFSINVQVHPSYMYD